jgi:hypothetical protein
VVAVKELFNDGKDVLCLNSYLTFLHSSVV